MRDSMRDLLKVVLALLILASTLACVIPQQPPVPPVAPTTQPAAPSPVCWRDVQRACDCYHQPPGQGWQKTPPCAGPPPALSCPEPIWGGLANPAKGPGQAARVDAAIARVSSTAKVSDDPAAGPLVVNGHVVGFGPDPTDPTGDRNGKRFLRLLCEDLKRELGRCCWVTDELLLVEDVGDRAGRYRAVNFPTGKIIDAANAHKADEVLVNHTVPGPAPLPTGPPPGACPFTPAGVSVTLQVKHHAGQTLDSTPKACREAGGPPCVNPDPRLAKCCLLSSEKGNQACADALFGTPIWEVWGGRWLTPHEARNGPVTLITPVEGVGAMAAKVAETADGGGIIRLRGSIAGEVCLRVFKGNPPCTIGADGGCATVDCPR